TVLQKDDSKYFYEAEFVPISVCVFYCETTVFLSPVDLCGSLNCMLHQ
ncbi:12665_t:CDS:1, partial [Racocetra persica]